MCSTVPVLDICGDIHNIAGIEFPCFLAPFLIISLSANAYQHLTAAFFSVVDVPVVAASELECDVVDRYLLSRNRCQIALSDEELTVGTWLTYGEKQLLSELIFFSECRSIVRIDFFGNVENCPGVRPACIESSVGYDSCNFFL